MWLFGFVVDIFGLFIMVEVVLLKLEKIYFWVGFLKLIGNSSGLVMVIVFVVFVLFVLLLWAIILIIYLLVVL